ncbi:hypothetical protein AB0D34_35580 [Streptomyces sp. NPDC048420]|uniref:hypothetical protein n=1 Tax=Streptomyces sp. NPDC048420 TaxID=3155755 RepID=UPI00343546E7
MTLAVILSWLCGGCAQRVEAGGAAAGSGGVLDIQSEIRVTLQARAVSCLGYGPYTLVMTKPEELFTRERTARRQAEADLTWLRSTWNASPDGSC